MNEQICWAAGRKERKAYLEWKNALQKHKPKPYT